ncbi:MAG: GntR family transcriptional regulator [Casimicrobiaceae bacterium]
MGIPVNLEPSTASASETATVVAGPHGRGDAESASSRDGTLPARLAERLREFITQGELAPGARLHERALCLRLGVSRTPLREAFRLLAADGLLVQTPNRGAVVVALSDTDIRESFEVMSSLEALSGELACAHVTDDEIAEIRALTFEMLACHARRDLPNYYRINRSIHERIVRAARNRLLADVYERLNRRIQHLRFQSNLDPDKWNRAARDHTRMVEALAARDAAGLASLLRIHLQDKGHAVLDGIMAGRNAAPGRKADAASEDVQR